MGDDIILKSGKIIKPNGGFVSINQNLDIAEGWDGGMPLIPTDDYYDEDKYAEKLTKEETLELADIMINRWQQFRKVNE